MNPREAEKLLGGYATGTLDEAERKVLFAAALEDQALFDALADEEALRELLADPAARAHLLAALEPAKVRPLWRRPGAMTLAASLLAAVGVGILLKHTKTPELRVPQQEAASILAAPAPKVVPPETTRDKTPSQPLAPEERPEGLHAKKARPEAPQSPPPPPPPAKAAPSAAPAPAQSVAEADLVATESKPAANQAAAGAGAAKAEERQLPRAQAGGLTIWGAPQGGPVWTWEETSNGHQLAVLWGPGGYLSLVARNQNGPRVVTPLTTTRQTDGRLRSVFALPKDATPLDLFWLSYRSTSFPADGFVNGFRARVWPEKP